MAGPKMVRRPPQNRRECALPGCDGVVLFGKDEYNRHMLNHSTNPPPGRFKCETCNWPFDDSLALELHQRDSGHVPHECDKCQSVFGTASLLGRHKQFPSPCSDAFGSRSPKHHCNICKKSFSSMASFNGHLLMCTPVQSAQQPQLQSLSQASMPILPVLKPRLADSPAHLPKSTIAAAQQVPALQTPAGQLPPPLATVRVSGPITVPTTTRVCDIDDCKMFFKSEAELEVHKQSNHGIGSKRLDTAGKDSWMLSSSSLQQLKDAGVLRSAGGLSAPSRGPPNGPAASMNRTPPPFRPTMNRVPPPPSLAPTARAPGSSPRYKQTAPVSPLQGVPIAPLAGLEEMNQARQVCENIMRLVLQSDVFIHHTGKMTCSDIDWTRIPSAKQGEVVNMFSSLCHLPPKFKTEFVPAPITYKDEYMSTYPATELQLSPELSASTRSLPVVAISCSKVILSNGLQEAVKIAAVDVVSCRILMSHLICTDPKNPVKQWNSNTTGLSDYHDIEAARQDGYKVLKGWVAARAALWKFISRDTVLVGWNIRADLDALRMIHGRAVDVAKTFEKAAGGPLSKPQVSLESLCRDLPAIKLTNHSIYGRDALQNAFAAREVGLWMLKNNDKLTKIAKQKALDYSRLA